MIITYLPFIFFAFFIGYNNEAQRTEINSLNIDPQSGTELSEILYYPGIYLIIQESFCKDK